VVRQQELLYNVEFQLQQMERKVARAKGERSDEETRALNARIKGLTTQLEGVNAQHSMLLAQVKKAEDDLSRAIRTNNGLMKDRGTRVAREGGRGCRRWTGSRTTCCLALRLSVRCSMLMCRV